MEFPHSTCFILGIVRFVVISEGRSKVVACRVRRMVVDVGENSRRNRLRADARVVPFFWESIQTIPAGHQLYSSYSRESLYMLKSDLC